jgi:cell division protein FtsB
VAGQRAHNETLKARNQALDADVRDLKAGYEAIEERARSELGMIRRDEIFFQVLERGAPQGTPSARAPAGPPAP